jgi:hypothetical protein
VFLLVEGGLMAFGSSAAPASIGDDKVSLGKLIYLMSPHSTGEFGRVGGLSLVAGYSHQMVPAWIAKIQPIP